MILWQFMLCKWSEVIHDIQSAQISQKQDGCNIYAIMKTMCPPSYHRNCLVTTHALGHTWAYHVPKCMSCLQAIVVIIGRAHCFHDCIYIKTFMVKNPLILLYLMSLIYFLIGLVLN